MFYLKALWSDRKQPSEGLSTAATQAGLEPVSSIPRSLTPFPRSEIRDEPVAEVGASVETRGAGRFVPTRTGAILVTDNGKKLRARIINVSALGVAVEADFSQIAPQSIVMVGERKVTLGRKIARGIVFLFEKPLPPSLCNPQFIA